MSEVVTAAVAALNDKIDAGAFDGTAKFDIAEEGCVMIDDQGARAGDEPADVTLGADADTFQEILTGALDPTAAFMTGRLSVDGDMGKAMQLAGALS